MNTRLTVLFTAVALISLSSSGVLAQVMEEEEDDRPHMKTNTFKETKLPLTKKDHRKLPSYPREIVVADIDGDRDNDVLVAKGDKIYWVENRNRKATKLKVREIPGIHIWGTRGKQLLVHDLNGDRNPDIVAATGGKGPRVFWNKGKATKWKPKSLLRDKTTTEVALGDFNKDKRMDLLADIDGLSWFANLGKGKFGAAKQILKGSCSGLNVADFDGDGDTDAAALCSLASSRYSTKYVTLALNNGSSWKVKSHSEVRGVPSHSSMVAGDMDGDGDVDLVGLTSKKFQVHLWTNDGKGVFTPKLIIVNIKNTPSGLAKKRGMAIAVDSIFVADVDRDGGQDIIAVGDSGTGDACGLIWWRRSGNAWKPNHFAKKNGPGSIAGVGDLNGDGKVDVLGSRNRNRMNASGSQDLIFWKNVTKRRKGKRRKGKRR